MPEDVQYEMYRTLPGLENVKIVRDAYAIEYDCINANQLYASLELRKYMVCSVVDSSTVRLDMRRQPVRDLSPALMQQ